MKKEKLNSKDKLLIKKARALVNPTKVREGYVKEVGCALITKKGKIFTGANIDLPCGIGFCAEHSAVSNMTSHSNETQINTIVACTHREDKKVIPPCGRCRELMNVIDKNNQDTWVIISNIEKVKLRDLLPYDWE